MAGCVGFYLRTDEPTCATCTVVDNSDGSQVTCTTSANSRVGACAAGYNKLDGATDGTTADTCVVNTCTCDNGVAAIGTDTDPCLINDNAKCASCTASGFFEVAATCDGTAAGAEADCGDGKAYVGYVGKSCSACTDACAVGEFESAACAPTDVPGQNRVCTVRPEPDF
jgi:hypothetical protein